MKSGDKLVFSYKGIKPWRLKNKPKEGHVCEINRIEYNHVIISIKVQSLELNLYFNFKDQDSTFYIWDWFLHPAEWRDKQINSILDE